MAQEITDQNINDVLTENKLTVLYFSAAWCGPCRVFGPMFDEWSKSQEEVSIGKINVDENRVIAEQYGIRSIPAVLFLKDGDVVEKLVGAQSKGTLQKTLEALRA